MSALDVAFRVRLEVEILVDRRNPSKCGGCAFDNEDGGGFMHCALFGGRTEDARVPECFALTNGKPCTVPAGLESADDHCARALGDIP
jgi:hypothetical protein